MKTEAAVKWGRGQARSFFLLRITSRKYISALSKMIISLIISIAYAIGVFFISRSNNITPIPSTIMTYVSVVMGMLLVFRTNTAYDRYYDGRRLWATIEETVSNLLRNILVMVDTHDIEEEREKIQALKNCVAVAYAIQEYLLTTKETVTPHLYKLLPKELKRVVVLKNAIDEHVVIDIDIPDSLKTSERIKRTKSMNTSKRTFSTGDINLALRLVYILGTYINGLDESRLRPVSANALQTQISMLISAFKGCIRIQTTPLPRAYSSHLIQSTWMYLLILPWSIAVKNVGILVGLQFIISFMLLGTIAIAEDIEEPFGRDLSDLKTASFCDNL
ncbi:UPF0187 protein, partial [Zancudomyces culisetae]